MKRILAVCLGLMAVSAFAEVDPLAREEIDIIRRGRNHAKQIQNLRVKDNATIGGTLTVTGVMTSSGGISATTVGDAGTVLAGVGTAITGLTGAEVTHAQVAQSVTNGQVVTLTAGKINVLTSWGSADANTNTVTLAELSAASVGKPTYVVNVTGATNLLAIAQSGFWKSDAVELSAGEMLLVVPVATNAFYGK